MMMVFSACGTSASRSTRPSETAAQAAPEAPAAETEVKPPTKPSLKDRCAGPLLRSGRSGVLVCRSEEGPMMVFGGCGKCAIKDGQCWHPFMPNTMVVPACHVGEDCPSVPADLEAGPCAPECCDDTLGTLPPEDEEKYMIGPVM